MTRFDDSDADPHGTRCPWLGIRVRIVEPTGWTETQIHHGLRALERIRRETDAATAALVAALPDTRDSITGLARSVGISHREARRRRDVAAVGHACPAVLAMLGGGAISAEHVAALVPVLGNAGIDQLVAVAPDTTPEDFSRAVEQLRLASEHGDDSTRRQRAQRRLRFFPGPEGMLGLNGLLPPVEGATLRAMLAAIVDAKWRAEHPDRATVLGGHGGDTREQRTADALLEIAGITPPTTEERPNEEQKNEDQPSAGSSRCDPSGPQPESDAQHMPPKVAAPRHGQPAPPTRARPAKPAVVIVFDIDKYEAEIAGHGPIPVTASLFDPARADLYYCYKNSSGEVLKFGRARRDPTPMQRLAVITRDRHCIYPGCQTPASACDIHHLNEWLNDHGFTDVEVLGLFCEPHHRHLHVNNLNASRETDGTVTIRDRTTGRVVARASPRRGA